MVRLAAVLLLLAACADEVPDKTAMCKLASQASAATVQDRKIIGAVAPYQADEGLAARDEELQTSIAARRRRYVDQRRPLRQVTW